MILDGNNYYYSLIIRNRKYSVIKKYLEKCQFLNIANYSVSKYAILRIKC